MIKLNDVYHLDIFCHKWIIYYQILTPYPLLKVNFVLSAGSFIMKLNSKYISNCATPEAITNIHIESYTNIVFTFKFKQNRAGSARWTWHKFMIGIYIPSLWQELSIMGWWKHYFSSFPIKNYFKNLNACICLQIDE